MVQDIESVLGARELYFPTIQLTQKGRAFDASEYADAQQRILGLRLMQLHAQGATVVMSQAQSLFANLDTLCREVMQWMQMRCQTNVYLSPAGNQGFNAHYDTHDVFILQISGTKTFNFYEEGVDLPFTDDPFDRSIIESWNISDSIKLQAGDTLYIPRGVVHDAVAEEQRSLHITLGLFPVIARDLLQEMIQVAAEQDRRFRQSFALDSHEQFPAQQIHALFDQLDDPTILTEARLRLQERLSLSVAQNTLGALDNVVHSESLDNNTLLMLKPSALINFQRTGSTLILHGFGQVLEFDVSMADSVQFILQGEPFRPRDLNRLSQDQQQALCKRLLRENLIERAIESA